MLLAELRGKLKATFACATCGDEAGVAPEAIVAAEDVLTSYVFGALRYLRPELGLLPLLHFLELPIEPKAPAHVAAWPRANLSLVKVDDNKLTAVCCEPDVLVETPTALVVVEVKLSMRLGTEPNQLPKEAIVAYQRASSRPWRLLCITPGSSEPQIASFREVEGRLVPGAVAPLADAVTSYFAAAADVGRSDDWPTSREVKANVRWLPWSRLGALIAEALERNHAAPHEVDLVNDLLDLLRNRGLLRPPFRGFSKIPSVALAHLERALWRRPEPQVPSLWGSTGPVSPWPRPRWFTAWLTNESKFHGFQRLAALQTSTWTKPRWLRLGARNAGFKGFTAVGSPLLSAWPGAIWRRLTRAVASGKRII